MFRTLRNGNLQTLVTVGSNFEAIEPLGTARRWSKEDKDYIGVARPALIGSSNKSTVKEWNWSNRSSNFYLPLIRTKGIGHFSCITRSSNTVVPPIGGISIQFMAIVPHIWVRVSFPWPCTINCKLLLKSTPKW